MIYPGELVGKSITIVASPHKKWIGWQGKIIDETKSSLLVSDHGTVKRLLKRNLLFKLGSEIVSGTDLIKRPEERLKGK